MPVAGLIALTGPTSTRVGVSFAPWPALPPVPAAAVPAAPTIAATVAASIRRFIIRLPEDSQKAAANLFCVLRQGRRFPRLLLPCRRSSPESVVVDAAPSLQQLLLQRNRCLRRIFFRSRDAQSSPTWSKRYRAPPTTPDTFGQTRRGTRPFLHAIGFRRRLPSARNTLDPTLFAANCEQSSLIQQRGTAPFAQSELHRRPLPVERRRETSSEPSFRQSLQLTVQRRVRPARRRHLRRGRRSKPVPRIHAAAIPESEPNRDLKGAHTHPRSLSACATPSGA